MFCLKSLFKVLAVFSIFTLLIGCGKAGTTSSTAPSESQLQRLEQTRTAAEEAESAYYKKKLERIELERQLEDR